MSRADAANRVYVLLLGAAEGQPPPADYVTALTASLTCPHMPSWARALRAGPDAVRYLRTRCPTYKERRQFVATELGPWLAHFEKGVCATNPAIRTSTNPLPQPATATAGSGFQVFLCHAKEDIGLVRRLYRELKEAGFKPWLDEEDLLGGHDWKQVISAAIRSSDALIVCLSQVAVTKTGYVQREIKEALEAAMERPEGKVFIVPVRLDECPIPASLEKWHAENAFDGSFQRLVGALNVQLGKPSTIVPTSGLRGPAATDPPSAASEMGRPAILRVEATTHPHKGGVTIRLVLDADSTSPVNWLEGSFEGPRGNIWGGGNGRRFVEFEPGRWRLIFSEEISRFAPSGVYVFRNLRVKNEAMLASNPWQPDVALDLTPAKS